MKRNYKESFEQIKIAGSLAAKALAEVTTYIKPGVTTNKIDKICCQQCWNKTYPVSKE